jgi:Bax protein
MPADLIQRAGACITAFGMKKNINFLTFWTHSSLNSIALPVIASEMMQYFLDIKIQTVSKINSMKITQQNVKERLKSLKTAYIAAIAVIVLIVIWSLFHLLGRPSGHPVKIVEINSTDSIVMHTDSMVTPVLYSNVPDLSQLEVRTRKERFINLMLPAILLAQEKMATERLRMDKLINEKENGSFAAEDSILLHNYIEKFKAHSARDLLERMQPHPVSIILAQAAIESGWGTSRFFREANNIYGVWSFNSNEKRIRAGETRGDKKIFLKRYDTLFQSVYDYLLVIARANAYKDFRNTRMKSQNAYRLIWFLSNYSEKRVGYVIALRQMIEFNDLTQYDHYQLDEINMQDENWKKLLEL